MSSPKTGAIVQVHRDTPLFREAVNYTSAETLFSQRLIEKDYFCTLLLHHLATKDNSLIFKGGTCLAKVHSGFYRLSEDLDFAIPAPLISSRSQRSRMSDPLKNAIYNLANELDVFRLIQPLTGANNSMQYIAVVGYQSLLGGYEEIIRIELGLREPLIMPPVKGSLKTILLNPVSGNPMMPSFYFQCISYEEGMAEKFRAALSRREPAIRDFYDIDYAIRKKNFTPDDEKFIDLVLKKVAVPGNEPVNITDKHYDSLIKQLDTELRPVLRGDDYKGFDLERVFEVVRSVANRLKNIPSLST